MSVTAIIGSRGRMGAMLMERLEAAGQAVRGVDMPLTPDVLAGACAGADVALLCVPAAVLGEVAMLAAPHLRAGAVLADIASVKMLPVRAMRRAYAGPVVGTHPLFGPSPRSDYTAVCVTPAEETDDDAARVVEGLFEAMGCTTFRSTPEAHDRAMAAVQGLNFITSVAYFAMLSQRDDIVPFLTPSLQRRTEAARSMLTSDAALFTGIFESNPMSQDVVREYRSFLNVAAGGDVDVLTALAGRWFREH
ncbi:MAG: prephenate dehydrogenase [Desulfovibrionaceae bacterium]|nr:prephenate dehydrogenase [Desulfovibrionaceae bacterium]